MLAALWAVSNGRCYAPGCPLPVVFEVRPGVYQKSSQVAHIFGVRPGAARYRGEMSADVRDSFANLLILCTAHHEEVDAKGAEQRYPPELLKEWKRQHEAADGSVLKHLTFPDTDELMKVLVELAEPPLARLEAVTRRLEESGMATAEVVSELKQIARVFAVDLGLDARVASRLAFAAEVFSSMNLSGAASNLAYAAETLPEVVTRINASVQKLQGFM